MKITGYESPSARHAGLRFMVENRLRELEAQVETAEYLTRRQETRQDVDADLLKRKRTGESSFGWLLRGESVDEHLDALAPALSSLPEPEAGRAWEPLTQRVGIIADEFVFRSFDGLADFVQITPKNYEQHIAEVDLLLVVTTWRGVDGSSWVGLGSPGSQRRRILVDELIPAYRNADVPVIFYSKEDPPNYERFLPIAQACDVIFTSAMEKVLDYRRDCPSARFVDVLKFGVNPRHHSPIGSRPGQNDMAYFAGAWLPEKYPQRTSEGQRLLRGILEGGRRLALIDRYSDLKGTDPRYAYTSEFKYFLGHKRDHSELMSLQRISDMGINLNSVADSQTMFANRVLELQAAGALVFSTYNKGVNSDYPQVYISTTTKDVARTLEVMTFEEMRRAQADGIRKVFSEDHAQLRVDQIVAAAGFDVPDRSLTVVAIAEETSPELVAAMQNQSLGPVEIIASADLSSIAADVVLPLSNDLAYGVHYAKDMVTAFTYTDADIVAKSCADLKTADEASHRYLDEHRELGSTAWWLGRGGEGARSQLAESISQGLPVSAGLKVYGLDGFGVSRVEDVEEPVPARAEDYEISVVVPIYNNGDHLRHKAFASLQRSSIFDKMHILLIDDGSTDPSTRETVRELERRFENVTAFMFEPGGSGSASRPRNKGLELTETEFVTYLDPDDEMINDGYALLLRKLQKSDAEFVVGDMLRWDDGRGRIPQVRRLRQVIPSREGLLRPDPSSLSQLDYQPASIEAIAARTDWLKGLGIEQPVGAVGQDTFFFQQMLYYATKIATVKTPVYAYYAAVAGSVVNVVSPRYFRKYLPLEAARAKWLKDVGLLQDYNERRLEMFFKKWYMRKLTMVAPDDHDAALELIKEIVGYYEPTHWNDPEIQAFWEEVNA
ncbi:glycosyltransferase [Zhihengliuella halotolerans]|uniref:Glycosyl transferase family 2 n=1 Tax=Zhihengliuella halotolerans TaxID=370736 RepID=A0A4V6MGF1_9MICC|nr:glycosyltransferase [Zhihengliuella halotolerans]RZU61546.1 glycosyl transferase family 2 [Zhihengliuella halotolerans]